MSKNQKWNIKNEGRKWSREEVEEKYFKLCPEKIEQGSAPTKRRQAKVLL